MSAPSYLPDREPDSSPDVAELLRRELAAAGLAQADLARRADLSNKHVNQIMLGRVPLTVDVARRLGQVLAISPALLLTWDNQARAVAARKADLAAWEGLGEWLNYFPLQDLSAAGVLRTGTPVGQQVADLLDFFGVASPKAYEEVWGHELQVAHFKHQRSSVLHGLATWLRLVERAGDQLGDLPSLDIESLRHFAMTRLRSLTLLPFEQAVEQLRDACHEAGVGLVLKDNVKGSRASGAVLWRNRQRPLLALTSRYKRADSFWFAAAHELGHVILHPRQDDVKLADEEVRLAEEGAATPPRKENEANRFAAAALLPGVGELDLYRLRTPQQLKSLSQSIGVHPSQVAGSYGMLTQDWRRFGRLRNRTVEGHVFS